MKIEEVSLAEFESLILRWARRRLTMVGRKVGGARCQGRWGGFVDAAHSFLNILATIGGKSRWCSICLYKSEAGEIERARQCG